MDILKWTTLLSLGAQFVTWFLQFRGLSRAVRGTVLWGALWLETVVQIIESMFYSLFVSDHWRPETMMLLRYSDWFLTTPTMLVSLASFLYDRATAPLSSNTPLWKDFWFQHGKYLCIWVLPFNFLMLLFGLLARLHILDKGVAWSCSWICMGLSFYFLWRRLGDYGNLVRYTFYVWSGYGLAEMLPVLWTNAVANGLDVVAKNMFGVILSLHVLQS